MLATLAGALLLAALVLAPGWVAWRALGPRLSERSDQQPAPLSPIEVVAVVAASGVLLTGWLAFVLAEIGRLTLPLLTAAVAVVTSLLALGGRGRAWRLWSGSGRLPAADWAFLAVALVALVLALRPHPVVIGGLDAGVYVNTAAAIARTGGILVYDDVTQSLSPTAVTPRALIDSPDYVPAGPDGAIRHLMKRLPEIRFPYADFLRLDGFYVLDHRAGQLTPQFLHLYPTWLGVFGLVAGDDGLIYATPVLGWLGAVMVGLAGRRLFGGWTGTATLLILGLNSLQIWFLRHPLSEAFLQFLLSTAIYGWVAAHSLVAWGAGAGSRGSGAGDEWAAGSGQSPGASRQSSVSLAPTLSPRERAGVREAFADAPEPYLLGMAGVALGSFALAHAQFVFAVALLPPLAVWLRLSRRWRSAHWAFFAPILLLLAHAGLHILTFALGYFEGLYHHVLLDLWRRRWLFALLAGGLGGLLVLDWQRDRWWPLLTQPRLRRLGPPLAAALTGLVFAYAYLIRPEILSPASLVAALGDPGQLAGYIGAPVARGPEENLVRVGWYLSPLGMVLAGLGAAAIAARLDQRLLLWAGLAGLFGLAFNIASFTHESYIYSLRRFVPVVLPFLSLAAAFAAVQVIPGLLALGRPSALRRRLGQATGLGALALLTLFFAVTGRTIIGHVEYEGAPQQIAAIAAHFAPDDLIIFSGHRDEPHKLATPLRFFHGLDALVISTNNPRGDLIEDWLKKEMQTGRHVRVVLGDNGGKLLLPGYRLEPTATLTLTLRELERLADQKPYNVQTNVLQYTLYDLRPAEGAPLPGPPYRYATGPGDELATVVGWYGRETDPDGTAYRWTNGDALLRLPWPAKRGPMLLRLHLSGGVRPAALGPARLDLFLARGQNDRTAPRLASLTLSADFETYEVTVPPDLLPDQPTGTVMLALRSPPWQPSEAGLSYDNRPLGVRLAWLELEPAPRAA